MQAAVDALNAGRIVDAQTAVQQLLYADADNPQAHHLAGVIAMLRGRPKEAVRSFTSAVQRNPHLAQAHSNLGLARLECGFGEEAVLDCRRAVDLDSANAELVFNLAVALEAGGQLRESEQQYRRVLALDAAHAKALLNLATVLHRQGDNRAAEHTYVDGQQRFPDVPAFDRNLGHLYLMQGRLSQAEQCFRRVLDRDQNDLGAIAGIAAAKRRLGLPREAAQLCLSIPADNRDPDLWRQLGMALLEQGKLEQAIEAFEQGMHQKRQPGDSSVLTMDQQETSLAKLRHDLEQLLWLEKRDSLPDEFRDAPGAMQRVLDELSDKLPPAGVFSLPFSARRRMRNFYNRLVVRPEIAALEGGAINHGLDADAVQADYRAHAPGMTVVDDFLRPAALAGLRRFCLASTFWFDFHHPNGYLGAYLEEGFHCPLLLQVADDLRALMPDVIGDLPLRQMWAYKYDSRLEGIEMHADFAAVNVNFWITPGQANLDSASGGMIVWDKEAPRDWDFEHYNSSAAEDQARIRKFLEAAGARARRVPYRENRAVIFNSDLFHKTDRINFADGYEQRRINITMLFGARREH